jgi:hypothetical protein
MNGDRIGRVTRWCLIASIMALGPVALAVLALLDHFHR